MVFKTRIVREISANIQGKIQKPGQVTRHHAGLIGNRQGVRFPADGGPLA